MSESAAKAKDDPLVVEKKNGNGSKKQKQVSDPSLNMDELRELANLVIEHGFTDFEFENENIRVRLSKMTGVPIAQSAPVAAPVATAPVAAASTEPGPAAELVDEDAGLSRAPGEESVGKRAQRMTAGRLDEHHVGTQVAQDPSRRRRRLAGEIDDAGPGQECFGHRSSRAARSSAVRPGRRPDVRVRLL